MRVFTKKLPPIEMKEEEKAKLMQLPEYQEVAAAVDNDVDNDANDNVNDDNVNDTNASVNVDEDNDNDNNNGW